MSYETASDLSAVGGQEDPMRPDMQFPAVPGGTRDSQTDARTQSEVAGQMSRELDMSGTLSDADVGTIWEEKQTGGWTHLTHPVGGMPADGSTSGTRGAADIRNP